MSMVFSTGITGINAEILCVISLGPEHTLDGYMSGQVSSVKVQLCLGVGSAPVVG